MVELQQHFVRILQVVLIVAEISCTQLAINITILHK